MPHRKLDWELIQNSALYVKKRATVKLSDDFLEEVFFFFFFAAAAAAATITQHFCTTIGPPSCASEAVSKRQRLASSVGPPNSLSSNQSHRLHVSPISGGLQYTGT